MSRFRQFAPGDYDGKQVGFKTAAERKALIGKRIGFDLRGSCMKHYGTVIAVHGREIELENSIIDCSQFEQIVILHDQGEPA